MMPKCRLKGIGALLANLPPYRFEINLQYK